ncbi:MAG: hypothetical protein AAF545_09565 [Pseudomonadota bacterium]
MDELGKRLARLNGHLEGDSPAMKQLMLMKLVELLDGVPSFSDGAAFSVPSDESTWLSSAWALLDRFEASKGTMFRIAEGELETDAEEALKSMKRLIEDAIAELKLDSSLAGREKIGHVYPPNAQYDYFKDLTQIVSKATASVFVVDPYFDGNAFRDYLSDIGSIEIRILGNCWLESVSIHAKKHLAQYNSDVQIKRSAALHDRLIILDSEDVWLAGGSIKDGGKKPTYLIPLPADLARMKRDIYEEIWESSNAFEVAEIDGDK